MPDRMLDIILQTEKEADEIREKAKLQAAAMLKRAKFDAVNRYKDSERKLNGENLRMIEEVEKKAKELQEISGRETERASAEASKRAQEKIREASELILKRIIERCQ